MYLIVLPSQALRDTNPPPLLFAQQPQRAALVGIEEGLRDHLEERFWKNNVAVLVLIVRVTIRVVDSVERARYEGPIAAKTRTTSLLLNVFVQLPRSFGSCISLRLCVLVRHRGAGGND